MTRRLIELTQLGKRRHLTGWRCHTCGEDQPGQGYRDRAVAEERALAHAMVCADDWEVRVIFTWAYPTTV